MKKILIAAAIALSLSSVTAAHAESPSNVTQYKESIKPDARWGKDKERIRQYNLQGMLANNPFSPGVKQDVMLQALQNIHDNRPAEIGDKVGKLELIDGNDNLTYKIAVVNYTNGQLKVKMSRAGPCPLCLGNGKDIKYIIYELEWMIGNPGQAVVEPTLDIQ